MKPEKRPGSRRPGRWPPLRHKTSVYMSRVYDGFGSPKSSKAPVFVPQQCGIKHGVLIVTFVFSTPLPVTLRTVSTCSKICTGSLVAYSLTQSLLCSEGCMLPTCWSILFQPLHLGQKKLRHERLPHRELERGRVWVVAGVSTLTSAFFCFDALLGAVSNCFGRDRRNQRLCR